MTEPPATQDATSPVAARTSSWSPLRQPLFRALWIATIVSNVGTWMHDVGAAWLMTTLDPDPRMIALVQAATTLPMFAFALPAGVLADILDRRRFLMSAQIWMLAAAAALGLLTLLGLTDAILLLALTVALGIGAALNAPPFQAVVPELVPRPDLPAAVALNSLGVNISRAIGPALGGLIVASLGPAAVFVLNAVSVLGVLAVLWRWRREPRSSRLPPEYFIPALRTGIRYVGHAPELRIVLLRAALFFAFASAFWALLPAVARLQLGTGPAGYGILLACLGAGAVLGALALPRLREWISANTLVAIATATFAGATAGLALLGEFAMACACTAAAGAAWIAVLSSLGVAAQGAVSDWARARALSVYLVVMFGCMAVGSAIWGDLAARFGIPAALVLAAACLLLGLAASLRFPVAADAGIDRAPSMHWPAPLMAPGSEPQAERGPALVTVEYRIDPARAAAFFPLMRELRRTRRRDGALSWNVYEDVASPGHFIETFVLESWVAHLRQHERVTGADRDLQERLRSMQIDAQAPIVRHYIARRRSAIDPT